MKDRRSNIIFFSFFFYLSAKCKIRISFQYKNKISIKVTGDQSYDTGGDRHLVLGIFTRYSHEASCYAKLTRQNFISQHNL